MYGHTGYRRLPPWKGAGCNDQVLSHGHAALGVLHGRPGKGCRAEGSLGIAQCRGQIKGTRGQLCAHRLPRPRVCGRTHTHTQACPIDVWYAFFPGEGCKGQPSQGCGDSGCTAGAQSGIFFFEAGKKCPGGIDAAMMPSIHTGRLPQKAPTQDGMNLREVVVPVGFR